MFCADFCAGRRFDADWGVVRFRFRGSKRRVRSEILRILRVNRPSPHPQAQIAAVSGPLPYTLFNPIRAAVDGSLERTTGQGRLFRPSFVVLRLSTLLKLKSGGIHPAQAYTDRKQTPHGSERINGRV